jgi:hypothetical protein
MAHSWRLGQVQCGPPLLHIALVLAFLVSISHKEIQSKNLDSKTLSDEELHFAKSHLLLSDSIPSGGPLITFKNRVLTNILTNVHNEDILFFVLSPDQKLIYKILHWREQQEVRVLGTYKLDNQEKIRSLAILPGEYLFVADDSRVSQYRIGQCSSHLFCQNCASDP